MPNGSETLKEARTDLMGRQMKVSGSSVTFVANGAMGRVRVSSAASPSGVLAKQKGVTVLAKVVTPLEEPLQALLEWPLD